MDDRKTRVINPEDFAKAKEAESAHRSSYVTLAEHRAIRERERQRTSSPQGYSNHPTGHQTSGQRVNNQTTGQRVNSQTTGQRVNSQTTGQRVNSQTTGQRVNSQTTGQRVNNQTTAQRIDYQTTGQRSASQTSTHEHINYRSTSNQRSERSSSSYASDGWPVISGETGYTNPSRKSTDLNNSNSLSHNSTEDASPAERETLSRRKGRAGSRKEKKKKKNKKFVWLKRIIVALLCLALIGILAGCFFVYSIIKDTPPINPQTIYDNLEETTKMYDADGKEIDIIFSDFNRDLADVNDMPENLIDAVIALEDKTFKTHHGFNIIRIFGAIVDKLLRGGQISGTSTITQQLARNIYLTDTRFEHNYTRKIQEAYYALRIEKELSKDEIIGAYLNTIYLGYGSYGVETASQNYFGKHVSELTLAECAALAALPQMPDSYQLIVFEPGGTAAAYPDRALKETTDGVYLANDASKDRREICLDLMLEQELITQAEHDEAMAVSLMDMLNPDFESSYDSNAAYFADYCISEVMQDLMEEKGMDSETAFKTVYQGGLRIYSTLDSQAQAVIREEFANPYNYPWVEPLYDYAGNIIDEDGYVKLYDYDNFFDSEGNFILFEDEYSFNSDGSLVIYYGNSLNIYTTEVAEGVEYSLEFKPMFYYDEDYTFYTISGGYVSIPRQYKSINGDNDIIISAEFLNNPDYAGYFVKNDDGTLSIAPKAYSLNAKSIQPQVAMTIVENSTGHIKAMVGGRNTSGRMIYNRAVSLRQPGSSIKPLGVYSAALQQSAEEAMAGYSHEFYDYKIDKQGTTLYGSYLTAASIVLDEKTTIDGEQWPNNDSNTFTGMQTMRSAMKQSINTCAVKIWYQVGADYSLQNVKNFGITTLVEEGAYNDVNPAALALGGLTNGVNTLEMASAYTTFPNNGVRYDTCSYTKVLDKDGNVVLDNSNPTEHQVLDPGVAWIMADMLHTVVESGTATNAYVPDTFVGGKTGTTQNEKDVWFDGFTTNYTASLWIGSDVAIDLSDNSLVATVLWGKIMRQIDAAYLGYRAEAPDNVIYQNGEYFISGTEKGTVSPSSIKKTVTLCKDTGLLATPECKNVSRKEYNAYDGSYSPPGYYCYLHNSDPNTYPVSSDNYDKLKEAEEKRLEEEEKKKQEEEEKKKQEEEEERLRLEEEERLRQEEEERLRQEQEQQQQENPPPDDPPVEEPTPEPIPEPTPPEETGEETSEG